MAGDADVASHLSEIFDVRLSSESGYVYVPVNVTPPPHHPSRDITGHLRGIFCYLTSERAAGIGDFDLFCTSSKNSGGVDQGIFHRGGLGRESLIRHLLTLNPLLLAH